MSLFNGLQPWLRPSAEYLLSRFPSLHVSSVFRSIGQQTSLYNQWARLRRLGYSDAAICAKGICTPAPPGQSYHNYGRAFDLNGDPRVLLAASQVWRAMGGRWFPGDPIHFEA